MFTDLKACYTPSDLFFIVSLFVMSLVVVGAVVTLCVHLVMGALEEVKYIKERKERGINTL